MFGNPVEGVFRSAHQTCAGVQPLGEFFTFQDVDAMLAGKLARHAVGKNRLLGLLEVLNKNGSRKRLVDNHHRNSSESKWLAWKRPLRHQAEPQNSLRIHSKAIIEHSRARTHMHSRPNSLPQSQTEPTTSPASNCDAKANLRQKEKSRATIRGSALSYGQVLTRQFQEAP